MFAALTTSNMESFPCIDEIAIFVVSLSESKTIPGVSTKENLSLL